MTDIVIGQIDGRTLRFHDEDGEGDFDHGERLSLGGDSRPLDEAAAREALARIGISGLHTGARMHRVAAYVDCLHMAERALESGEYMSVQSQLDQAERLAREGGFSVSYERLSALRWRAIEAARLDGAAGFEELGDAALETKPILRLLRGDSEAAERNSSAGLILDYLHTCRSRDTVRARGLEHERAFLADLDGRASRLRSDLRLRARHLHAVVSLGIEESRATAADHVNTRGITLHSGDRVQMRWEDGRAPGAPFVIDHFEIHASYIVAIGRGGERANIDSLHPAPLAPSPNPPVSRGSSGGSRPSWVAGAIRSVLSLLPF
ncbi:MAG TPA: hypothetical protein VLJ37_09575 [bacterium]|nr:hypothetical protein [bacterium]